MPRKHPTSVCSDSGQRVGSANVIASLLQLTSLNCAPFRLLYDMSKQSILQPDEKKCYLTGSTLNLDKHHIFNGPNRDWSDKEGLWVWLNHDVHMAIHQHRPDLARELKEAGQRAYEREHSREEFMRHVRKNYL